MISHFESIIIVHEKYLALQQLSSGILSWHTLHRAILIHNINDLHHHLILLPVQFRLIVFFFLNQRNFREPVTLVRSQRSKKHFRCIIKGSNPDKIKFLSFLCYCHFLLYLFLQGFKTVLSNFFYYLRVRRGDQGLLSFVPLSLQKDATIPHASLCIVRFFFSTKRCRFIINNGMNSFSTD
jgi:hypothetical protein